MNEKQKAGGFFSVELNQIDHMVREGAGSSEVITYLVLARGRGAKKSSRWGANSCQNYTAMSYHKADKATQWLLEKGFIQNISQNQKPQWIFKQSDEGVPVFLSNALIDGVGAGKENPPMNRLYTDIKMSDYGGREEARLDALMLLLHLYRHQSLRDYGGVNPASGLYREWSGAEAFYTGEKATEIKGTNAMLYEIKGESRFCYERFMAEVLFYAEDKEERKARFWCAVDNLSRLGWLYETTQVWSDNPSKNSRAEPLYTLYVHDKHQRETDPYLASEVNKVADSAIGDLFSNLWHHNKEKDDRLYRYIATKKNKAFPIGIYRLKFRPHTKDTGAGMYEEQQRVDEWKRHLATLLQSLGIC